MKCLGCGYKFETNQKGLCEYCRSTPYYGKVKEKFSQREQKSERIDADLEDMTDGDYVNYHGIGEFIKDEKELSE